MVVNRVHRVQPSIGMWIHVDQSMALLHQSPFVQLESAIKRQRMWQLVMLSMKVNHFFYNIFFCLIYATAMTSEQRRMVMELRDPSTPEDNDWEMLDEVLHGDEALGISHEGGELEALLNLRSNISESNERYVFNFLVLK